MGSSAKRKNTVQNGRTIDSTCELMAKLWEAGMNREIEQLNGPIESKDGLPIYYRCERIRIRYGE
ncbi:MAG: hypothetical protein IJJ23_10070 [Clostridia bacterium]|nr:hypothetical protein [Clostridia bacterium]